MSLKVRQERFCQEFVKSGNATEAYKLAGYDVKTDQAAQAASSKLLLNVMVQKYIDELNEKIENSKIASAVEIQQFLTKQMRGEAEEECITTVGVGDGCSEVVKVKKEITPKDRQKAGETLAKIKQLFTDGGASSPVTLVINPNYK